MQLLTARSLVAILLLAMTAFGQSDRGAISGLVVDQQDQVIPQATVALTNKATGARTEVTTDGSGSFLFPALVVGNYEIIAERTGFKRFIQSGIQVNVGRTSALTLTLSPGEVSETITIMSETSATLDTETSDTGTSVSRRQILDLPVPLTGSMRNPLNFVVLTPGVSGSVPGANPDLRLNISGTPAASAEVYIDGVPVADTNVSGAIGTNHPSLEAVGEFKISNNSYSAEYGLASAIISFTLRSGTNDFHGNVFEFHQNDKLNAFDFVTKATAGFNRTEAVKAPLKQNEYGFSLGGPVYLPRFGEGGRSLHSGRDRTFFFTSYTGFKFRPSANSFNLTTFPNRFRQGDFSQLLGAQVTVPNPLNPAQQLPLFDAAGRPVLAGAIYDPTRSRAVTGPDGNSYQIRDPFAGNVIPAGYAGLSSASRRILQDFPQAQTDALFNNFSRQLGSTTDQERFVVKIDHKLSSRQALAVSVSLGSSLSANNGTLNELSAVQNDAPSLQTRISHNFTFSPRLINSFSFGFLRDRFTDGPVVPSPSLSSLGLSGISLPPGSPFPAINIRNQNGIGTEAFALVAQNRFITSDTVTYVRGNHTLKFGGEFRRLQRNQVANNSGRFVFEPTQTALNGVGFVNTAQGPRAVSVPAGATGSSAASFLFGAVDFSRFELGFTTAGYRWLTASGFVQDDWKVTRNLTLNLGFRYDLSIPRTEVLGRVSTVDRTLPNPSAGGRLGAFTFFGEGPGRNGRKRIGDIDWTAFQPRVGLAYTPDVSGGILGALFGKESTVIRASFAITRPLGNDNIANGISGGLYQAGFNGVATANRPGDALGSPAFFLDQPFPGFTPPPTIDPGFLTGNANPPLLDSEIGRLPTQINWAFEVQRQLPGGFLASVGYVGTHIYHVGIWRKPNQVPREAAERFRGAAAVAGLPLNEFLNLQITDPRARNVVPLPFPNFTQLFGAGATVAQSLRPFPQYGNIDNLQQPVGSASYNGMLSKLQKRFSGGLTMLLSYTFSKTLGDVDSFQGAAAGAQNALFARSFQQDFYDNGSERSVTSSDIPHVLALSYTYELPIGPGKRFVNRGGVVGKITGGWQVSAIHLYQSGRPLFMEYQAFGANNPLRANDGFSFRPNRVAGVPVVNPAYDRSCSGPLLGAGRRSCQFYINPAAFVAPPPGEFGNAPKLFGDLRAQPYFNEDISISKRTSLGERFVLKIEVNAFNALNRVVLGTGGAPTTIFNLAPSNLNAATLANSGTPFGILTTQQNGPRRIQLGVKLEF